VGSPIANRNRAEIEGLIFINTLVMRTDLGNPSFRELLGCAQSNAYAHQDLPREVGGELQPSET